MWTRAEIKAAGKAAFKRNYWTCVMVSLLLAILVGGGFAAGRRSQQEVPQPVPEQGAAQYEQGLSELEQTVSTFSEPERAAFGFALAGGVATVSIVGFVLKIFVFNPLKVGCYRFFVKNATNPSTSIGVVAEGFGGYGRTFITLLLSDLFTLLWSLLFVIPGIMRAYSYRMVPYIVKDEPQLSATQVLARSKDMMAGNRWGAFVLDVSYVGWLLLGAITLNIVNIFWTFPYRYCADAELYLRLKQQ